MATRTRINTSATALWASAFVIVALIITQAGRLPGNEAHAGQSTWRGDYSVLTASAGTGGDVEPDELLFVLDSRDEVLLVYEVEDARRSGLTLLEAGSLNKLFK